eukprot:1568062-Amphidinium_carterae.2
MAADIDPASHDMHFQGFSGGGHLSKDTYPGDQIISQRRGDAAQYDSTLCFEESCDDTYANQQSIFAERSLPATQTAKPPRTLGSEKKVSNPIHDEVGLSCMDSEESKFGNCLLGADHNAASHAKLSSARSHFPIPTV